MRKCGGNDCKKDDPPAHLFLIQCEITNSKTWKMEDGRWKMEDGSALRVRVNPCRGGFIYREEKSEKNT